MVEAAHLIRLAVVQLQPFYLSIFSCQITDRLLASMKVDPDIYCHRRLLLLTQIVSTVSVTTHGRRRLLHTNKRTGVPARAARVGWWLRADHRGYLSPCSRCYRSRFSKWTAVL